VKKLSMILLTMLFVFIGCNSKIDIEIVEAFKMQYDEERANTVDNFCDENMTNSYFWRITTKANVMTLVKGNNREAINLTFSDNRYPKTTFKSYYITLEDDQYIIEKNDEKGVLPTKLFLFNEIHKNKNNIEFDEKAKRSEISASYIDGEYLMEITRELIIPYAPDEFKNEFMMYLDNINEENKLVFSIPNGEFRTMIYPILEEENFYISEFCS